MQDPMTSLVDAMKKKAQAQLDEFVERRKALEAATTWETFRDILVRDMGDAQKSLEDKLAKFAEFDMGDLQMTEGSADADTNDQPTAISGN